MQELGTELQSQLNNMELRLYLLISIGEAPFKHNATSFHSPVEYDGEIYMPSKAIVGVEPPARTSAVDKEAFKIQIAKGEDDFTDSLEDWYIGRPVKAFIGPIDNLGRPVTTPGDVICLYRGFVISVSSTDRAMSSKALVLTCGAPLSPIQKVNLHSTDRRVHRRRYPNDSSMDAVGERLSRIRLLWGRNP